VTRFLAWRLVVVLPTLFGVLVVAFLLLHVAPGDPVQAMVGERADSATMVRLRAELNLDEPLPKRFVLYTAGVLKGDLGKSYITGRPILGELLHRFPYTLRLALAAMLFAVSTGLVVGIFGAWRPGSWFDRVMTLGAYLGVSFPVYWVGLLLILVFAVQLHWLPPSGSGGLAFLVLPALTLAFLYMGLIARVTRASVLEVLAEDYVRTARAKGLRQHEVLARHALKNAAVPIVTVVGIGVAALLGGVVVTETVFNIPGLGRLAADAISQRDYPVVQGLILLFAASYVAINLLVDLSYLLFDPRIRY